MLGSGPGLGVVAQLQREVAEGHAKEAARYIKAMRRMLGPPSGGTDSADPVHYGFDEGLKRWPVAPADDGGQPPGKRGGVFDLMGKRYASGVPGLAGLSWGGAKVGGGGARRRPSTLPASPGSLASPPPMPRWSATG
jgi:hypothetical protein